MKFIWYVALLLLQLVDFGTTVYILKNGGRELNPVLARAFAWADRQWPGQGVEIVLLVAKAAVIGGIALVYHDVPALVMFALAGIYAYFMWGNANAALRIYRRKH